MGPGNLSQTVWKRSVLNQMKTESEQALLPFLMAEPCSAVKVGEETLVTAQADLWDESEQIGVYAIIKAINDLLVRGAKLQYVQVSFTFPMSIKESVIIRMMDGVKIFCREHDIALVGMKAQVQSGVILKGVHVAASGMLVREELLFFQNVLPGQEIILCGSLALEGMERMVDSCEKELKERFIPAFLQQMKGLRKELLQEKATMAAWGYVTAMRQIGNGGIWAELWSIAEMAKTGLKVELSQMTLCQETIEVCEYYRRNPYQMTSTGAILMITEQGEALMNILREQGVRASRLGVLEEGNKKIVLNGEEVRYLDRPAPDELGLWQEERLQK